MKDIQPIMALLAHTHALCTDEDIIYSVGSGVGDLIAIVKDGSTRGIRTTGDYYWADKGVFVFHFGAYGYTHVLATGSLEDALESAAGELPQGHFTEPDLPSDFASLTEDESDRVYNEACEDLTCTESGYLCAWEWTYTEFESLSAAAQWIYEMSGL